MSNTFVPWWGDKEVVTEYVAPGIRYIRDAKTGELLAFIEGEEDDDMLDNPNEPVSYTHLTLPTNSLV